jgi:hypothetical protein
MTPILRGYLAELQRQLHLAPAEEREILRELRDHVEDRAQELADQGISTDAALRQAMRELGEARAIAGRFYEVYSKGSWMYAVFAALPHLVLALIFALHLWTKPWMVAALLGVALAISFLGWRRGRPVWTYPWVGYALVVPLISWGLAMSAIGYGAWGVITKGALPLGIPIYAVSIAYIAFSLWVFVRILSRVARRDWLMASLTVLPLPFLGYWFLYFYGRKELLEQTGVPLQEFDGSVAVVFLVVAGATVMFFRIGRRFVRAALLAITAPTLIVLAWLSREGGPGYVALFGFSALSLVIMLVPALFDARTPSPQTPPEELTYALDDRR